LLFLVRQTWSEAMIVVAAKRSHSKAANTVAASAARHGPQCLEHPLSVNITASAMKPANQKIMVRDSAARIPNLCAVTGKWSGAMMRYTIARMVHTLQKRRKLADAGAQLQ